MEDIACATGKAVSLQVIITCETFKDCALEKAKKAGVSKTPVARSIMKGSKGYL